MIDELLNKEMDKRDARCQKLCNVIRALPAKAAAHGWDHDRLWSEFNKLSGEFGKAVNAFKQSVEAARS